MTCGTAQAELGRRVDPRDRARQQMLGQHHGRGLQHFNVFVGVLALGLVLNGQTPSTSPPRNSGTARKEW